MQLIITHLLIINKNGTEKTKNNNKKYISEGEQLVNKKKTEIMEQKLKNIENALFSYPPKRKRHIPANIIPYNFQNIICLLIEFSKR